MMDDKEKQVEIGCETVLITKMFGPLIFCDVQITADADTGNWIIEREWIKQDEDGNDYTEWEKICEFNGQESISFGDEG